MTTFSSKTRPKYHYLGSTKSNTDSSTTFGGIRIWISVVKSSVAIPSPVFLVLHRRPNSVVVIIPPLDGPYSPNESNIRRESKPSPCSTAMISKHVDMISSFVTCASLQAVFVIRRTCSPNRALRPSRDARDPFPWP